MNSNGRILTTHVGSLPRPDDLVEIMFAREDGIPIDPSALQERVEQAVDQPVARQVAAGVDIVNDGEWPKPSYATYIKDRLNGFGGTGTSYVFQDLEDFPRSKARMAGDPGRKHRKTPACNAPISVKDMDAPRTDAVRLKAAALTHGAVGTFMSAASPGVVALFFRNDHYPDHKSYALRSPRRCGTSMRRSSTPASCCRSIARTSRWGGTRSIGSCQWPGSAKGWNCTSRR